MQMSQDQCDFAQLPQRERKFISVRNQATFQRLSLPGHDRLTRARALTTLKMRTSSAQAAWQ